MLATAADELKFSRWPPEDPEDSRTLHVKSKIISFCWSSDNKYAIFLEHGGNPVIVTLKDMDSIKLIHTITIVNDATSVAFQKSSNRKVVISRISPSIALYDTKEKHLEKLIQLAQPATRMDFSATDEYLVVACRDGNMLLLNFSDGTVLCKFPTYAAPSSIKFHPIDEKLFAVGTKGGALFAYETDNMEPVYHTMLHDTEVFSVQFSTKLKSTLISASSEKFCVHNTQTRQCLYTGHLQCSITCMDITSDCNHFALGTEDGMVSIFKSGEYEAPLFKWKAHTGKITILKFARGHTLPIESSSECSTSQDPISSARDRILDDGGMVAFYEKYIRNAHQDKTMTHFRNEVADKIYDITRTIRLRFAAKMDIIAKYINGEFVTIDQREGQKWEHLNELFANAQQVLTNIPHEDYDLEIAESFETSERSSMPERPEMSEKAETSGRSEVSERAEIPLRPETSERSVRTERSKRSAFIERRVLSDISERSETSESSSPQKGSIGSSVRHNKRSITIWSEKPGRHTQ